MHMLGRIIGTSVEDLPWLLEKGDALVANTNPDLTDHLLDQTTNDKLRIVRFNSPAGNELFLYAKGLITAKDTSSVTTSVLHLNPQPGKDESVISKEELHNSVCLLLEAG